MKHVGEGTAVVLGLVFTAVPMGCRPTRTITKEDRAIADLKWTRMNLNKERQRVMPSFSLSAKDQLRSN